MTRTFLVATAVMTALQCIAFSAPAVSQSPKRGGTLNFAVVAEPPSLDCHQTTTFASLHPVRPQYSGLLRYSGDVNTGITVIGELVKSWDVTPDGLVYTFKLHDDVKFHDGSALTSLDVKITYQRIMNPPDGILSPRRDLHSGIAAIETPDATTVVFRLKAPSPSMINNFASPFNCIYSAAKLATNSRYPETDVMGSGPFQLVEYIRGSHWTAKRFDKYFLPGKPYLDGFKAYFIKSTGIVPGLQGGQFDAEFRGVSPKERDQLVAAMGTKVTVHEGPWTTGFMMTFNTRKKPFDDIRVRQALTMAIDRWGGSVPLAKISMLKFVGGVVRPQSEWDLAAADLETLPGYARDIAKSRDEAKRLLASAGATNLKVRFINRNIGEPYTTLGVYVADQWRRIGVETDHQQLETKLFFDTHKTGEFDATIDFVSDYVDDPNIQFQRFLTPARSPLNVSGSGDPRLDGLYDAQAGERDQKKRKAIADEFQKIAITSANSAMLFWLQRIVVLNSKVKGWSLPASHFTGYELADVWLDQ